MNNWFHNYFLYDIQKPDTATFINSQRTFNAKTNT